jgi:hypothetical protein
MTLFRRDYDLGFEYAIKLNRCERSTPSEIGATAARFVKHADTQASRAFSAGMVDAAISLAQRENCVLVEVAS